MCCCLAHEEDGPYLTLCYSTLCILRSVCLCTCRIPTWCTLGVGRRNLSGSTVLSCHSSYFLIVTPFLLFFIYTKRGMLRLFFINFTLYTALYYVIMYECDFYITVDAVVGISHLLIHLQSLINYFLSVNTNLPSGCVSLWVESPILTWCQKLMDFY